MILVASRMEKERAFSDNEGLEEEDEAAYAEQLGE
jgi:hypothetical protein